jgi:SAM-dependent methyltransferase
MSMVALSLRSGKIIFDGKKIGQLPSEGATSAWIAERLHDHESTINKELVTDELESKRNNEKWTDNDVVTLKLPSAKLYSEPSSRPPVRKTPQVGTSGPKRLGAEKAPKKNVPEGPATKGASTSRKSLEQRLAEVEERRKQLLEQRTQTLKRAGAHGSISSTRANRFPLPQRIEADAGFEGAVVALIGLGSGRGRIPPQVQEVAQTLGKVGASALTMVDFDEVTVSEVSKRLRELPSSLTKKVINADVRVLVTDAAHKNSYDRIISTETLGYPMQDYRRISDLQGAEKFMKAFIELLKPDGRLYVDTADTFRLIKAFLPPEALSRDWGDGLSVIWRSQG